MTAWFSKLFKSEDEPTTEAVASRGESQLRSAAMSSSPPPAAPAATAVPQPEPVVKLRRVLKPTVLVDEESDSGDNGGAGGIRIKARIDHVGHSGVFMVDRPVLEGYSAWFPLAEATEESALARSLFEVEGVLSVLIHDMNITVGRDPFVATDWEAWARDIGARIRAHLESGTPVVAPSFLERIPPEDEIRARIEEVLEYEINPGIAAHSGAIELERVEGNTVYIRMLGGCQGCAASTITLRQGVHHAFRDAVPALGAILDQTDHASGKNPYYRHIPGD